MRQTVLPGGIGLGLHPFRGLAVIEDFEAVRLPIDVAEFHTDASTGCLSDSTFLSTAT